jgi:hypothetical protein
MTSRAKPLCFKVYLIEGGQPTKADGQIIVSTGGFFFTGTEGSNPSPFSLKTLGKLPFYEGASSDFAHNFAHRSHSHRTFSQDASPAKIGRGW